MTKQLQQTVETVEKEFDNFGYVKTCILKSYCKNLLAGLDTKSLSVEIKNYYKNQFVFAWLNKINALKIEDIKHETTVDETGKTTTVYTINISDFDVNVKSTSKENKKYSVFDNATIGKALRYTLV